MARKAGKKRVSSPKMKGDTGPAETPASPVSIPAAQVASEEEKRAAMTAVLEASKKDGLNAKAKTNSGLTLGKAIKKAAEITGFDKEAIGWWVKNRERDAAEIDRETRERNKVAVYMDMPIGGQLGLLASGESVASARPSERDAKKDADPQILAAAEAQGHQAGTDGASFNSCEYPTGSTRRERWQTGWQIAQKARGMEMAGGSKTATHESARA